MLGSFKYRHAFVAGLAMLVLAGCAQFPSQMVGRFDGERDFIIIDKKGWISWSSKSETDRPPQQVGIGMVDGDKPLHVHVAVHSTSRFWPKLDFSPDYERVTVDWDAVAWGGGEMAAARERSTEYVRARPR
jgi:hypothetical protein